MSWDLTARGKVCPTCGVQNRNTWNCTHNVNSMMEEAGCRVFDLHGLSTDEAAKRLDAAVLNLASDRGCFVPMEHPTWGSYDDLVPILCAIRDFCRSNPGGTVEVKW